MFARCCCGCCSLRTGLTIFGFIAIVIAVAELVIEIIGFPEVNEYVTDNIKLFRMIQCGIQIATLIFLLVGCFAENRFFLIPSLIWELLVLIATVVVVIILVMAGKLYFLVVLVIVPIHLYIWLCILSYFLLLKEYAE